MSSPEEMDVTSSGVKDGETGAASVAMDTSDNKGVASTVKGDETAAGKEIKKDKAEGSAAGEKPSMASSGEGATGTGGGEGADGKKEEIEIIKDPLPEFDIVMCFGRCQDCTLKACKKIRSKNTKTDVLLCQECLDLHLQIGIDGESKLDINIKENQEDSKEYPPEKRVPWECKNRPNYSPAQRAKYIKEKYGKRVAFDNLDASVDQLQTKFEYQQVHSDGLSGGAGTFELSIPDFQKPQADEVVDGDGGKSGASAEGGTGDKTDATIGDKTSSSTSGGDSGMPVTDVEGVVSAKTEAAVEGGDSEMPVADVEGVVGAKTEAAVEGGDSEMPVADVEGVVGAKTEAAVEESESEMPVADAVSAKTEAAVEGSDIEMTDTTVEGDKKNDDTSSAKAKPKGSVTIEGVNLEKTTYDADVIRFIALANNGDSFFVQMCIELGEWDIKNYFFTLKDDTTLFQLVNNARRMMYIIRGEDDYSSDFLNYMEPINRLCQVKVTKIKKTKEEMESRQIYEGLGVDKFVWTKRFFASLDPEYLWLKETLDKKEDKALLLAYYNHDDEKRDIVDEVKLRYKRVEQWITTHIFTTNGFEYKMEACGKHDKDYHLLKSKMTRSPIDQGVLKDPPKFVDKVKYLMDIMHPVTFGIPKERNERIRRIWQRDHPEKTLQEQEEDDVKNEADVYRKWRESHGMPPRPMNEVLEEITKKAAQAKEDEEKGRFYKEPKVMPQSPSQEEDTFGKVDIAYDGSLTPSDKNVKEKWEKFCEVFKGKKTFESGLFDSLGLDPNNREGFDQCVSEMQSNFEIEDYESVIDQAMSILENYKKSEHPKIRKLVSSRHLMKFIYDLVVTPANEPMGPTIDTKDVPELAPKDKSFRETWNLLRATYNRKAHFPTNALNGKDVDVNSLESYMEFITEIQTYFAMGEFDKAIDLARAMLEVFFDSNNPSIKEKVMETSLLKFICTTIFGAEGLQDTADVGLLLAAEVEENPNRRVVEVNDVPDLEPKDEGFREMWNNFRKVFLGRTDFPTDALQKSEVNPNSREDFDNLVERVHEKFYTMDYESVIDVAMAMMEIHKDSNDEVIRAAMSESSLLKFIYMLIFDWSAA